MLVKFKDGQINDIEELNNLSIPLKDEIVKFSSLGEIEPKENTKVFYRYNRKDAKRIVFKESVKPDNSFINLEGIAHDVFPKIVLTLADIICKSFLALVTAT